MPKKSMKTNAEPTSDAKATARGGKSNAIREYMATHKNAMPKEIVAALKERGIVVSPNLVSILRAKQKVKSVRQNKNSADNDASSGDNAAALAAALTLYKAARSNPNDGAAKVRQAFLLLVETLG